MHLCHFAAVGVVLLFKWMRNILESTNSRICRYLKNSQRSYSTRKYMCMAANQLSARQKSKNFNILYNKNSICYCNRYVENGMLEKNQKLHNRVILGQNIIVN